MAPRSFRTAGYLAIVAGLILLISGVTSGSILLTATDYLTNYFGPHIGATGQAVLQAVVWGLTFLIGLGGLSVIIGGVLLLLRHGSLGRFLIGLGGGMAIFGLLFAMAEALYLTGPSAPIFSQVYFSLYWVGAILATVSYFLSRRARETKPIV